VLELRRLFLTSIFEHPPSFLISVADWSTLHSHYDIHRSQDPVAAQMLRGGNASLFVAVWWVLLMVMNGSCIASSERLPSAPEVLETMETLLDIFLKQLSVGELGVYER
jgi:hypothetical protein